MPFGVFFKIIFHCRYLQPNLSVSDEIRRGVCPKHCIVIRTAWSTRRQVRKQNGSKASLCFSKELATTIFCKYNRYLFWLVLSHISCRQYNVLYTDEIACTTVNIQPIHAWDMKYVEGNLKDAKDSRCRIRRAARRLKTSDLRCKVRFVHIFA